MCYPGAWHLCGHVQNGHPHADSQTERVNCAVEDVLRSVCAITPIRSSAMISILDVAVNNAVHASTGYTPFYICGLTHLRVPLTLPPHAAEIGRGSCQSAC